MNTMKKRVLSGIIATASAVSMVLPVFAAGTNTNTEITGTYSAPEIAVTVPPTGTAVINPYGLGMEVPTRANADVKKTVVGQIATAPLFIANESSLKLSVGASVVGEIVSRGEGDTSIPLKFAATTTKGVGSDPNEEGYVAPATAKSVYVTLQVANSTVATTDADPDTLFDAVLDKYILDASWTEAAKKELVVGTREVKGEDLATLEVPTLDTDGSVTNYKSGSVVMFRLTGDCTEAPKVAWDDKDSFKVNVAFTFRPAPAASGT